MKKREWVLISAFVGVTAIGALFWYRRELEERRRERRLKKQANNVNIGAVFGMDVGGTLAKVVYFERDNTDHAGAGTGKSQVPGSPMPQSSPSITSKSGQKSPAANAQTLPHTNSSNSLSKLDGPEHQAALQEFYEVMETTRNVVTKDSALLHDVGMSFYSSLLHGRLHFFHFETRNMVNAIDALAGNSDIAHNIRTIGCTGGGAHKFAKVVDDSLDIQFEQMDELGCLIRGMHFALTNVENECYTYRNAFLDAVPETPSPSPAARAGAGVGGGDASAPAAAPPVPPSIPELKGSGKGRSQSLGGGVSEAEELPPEPPAAPKSKLWQKDVKEYTQRVEIPKGTVNSKVNQFPYLVVNIGSGVSILKINGPGQHERVSGSSVGGGTYWGLCRLLMSGVTSYEEVLDKAETGDASEIDMLVRDIYGGGYDNISLSGSMVASSFGKLTMRDTPREGIREEDLAIALLMMITNNIGQVSYLNAKLHSCSKIYFVGSFLRHNQISCRRLAFAIDFWSKGTQEALFLQHEGYFGALGTFLQSAFGEDVDRVLNTFGEHVPDARDLFVKNEKAELFKATRARARSTGMVDIGKHRVQDGNISKLA